MKKICLVLKSDWSFMSKSNGFTLIEMVMVLVIIGLLASIVIPQFSVQMDDAKEAATRANLGNLRSSIAIYAKKNNGMYPPTLAELGMGPNPIITPVPFNDGWGTPFGYSGSMTGIVFCDEGMNPKCNAGW